MIDIRTKTAIIIKKNGLYLVGTVMGSTDLRWSTSKYDAWQTRDKKRAQNVARMTGGIMMLFNPIIGKEKTI